MSGVIDEFQGGTRSLSSQPLGPVCTLLEPQNEKMGSICNLLSQATFFHRAGWQRVIERALGHKTWFLYAELEGEIQGVLPLAEINSRLFGHSLSSLPFCVYGGIAAISERPGKCSTALPRHLLHGCEADYLEYRNLSAFILTGQRRISM